MKQYKIIGDEVEITTPAEVKLVGIETVYNQDKQDLVNIESEITEAQARIIDAEARKAERLARIALTETKVQEIVSEREALKAIQVEPVLETPVEPLVDPIA